jgi:hypothetical protein
MLSVGWRAIVSTRPSISASVGASRQNVDPITHCIAPVNLACSGESEGPPSSRYRWQPAIRANTTHVARPAMGNRSFGICFSLSNMDDFDSTRTEIVTVNVARSQLRRQEMASSQFESLRRRAMLCSILSCAKGASIAEQRCTKWIISRSANQRVIMTRGSRDSSGPKARYNLCRWHPPPMSRQINDQARRADTTDESIRSVEH